MIDLSRLEGSILKPNYLVLLGFSTGYVPLRVMKRQLVFYMYDPLVEGQISAPVPAGGGATGVSDLGYVAPTRLPSQYISGKPFNVFINTKSDHLYQLYYGISPSGIRVFMNQPAQTGVRNLFEFTWLQSYLAFGYVDGFESPIDQPSPNTEIIVPPNSDFALGYANPLPYPVRPLLQFVVNELQVKTITDVDLIMKMIEGKVPASIKIVGGLEGMEYDVPAVYGINPIQFDYTPAEVQMALRRSR